MGAFTVTVADGIARVALDLPGKPVNTITRAVREELGSVLDHLRRDADVRAAVLLSGKADTFIAGADIDEFVALRSQAEAPDLVRAGPGGAKLEVAAARPPDRAARLEAIGDPDQPGRALHRPAMARRRTLAQAHHHDIAHGHGHGATPPRRRREV